MSLPELLTSIMNVARFIINAEGSSLLLAEKDTGDLVFNVVIGEKSDILKGEKVPCGMGIAGIVAESKKSIIVNDVRNNPNFFSEIDKKTNFITRNIMGAPMMVLGEFVGVLEVVNSIGRDSFDDWDQEKIQYIADIAAVAIHNRQLYDELTKRIKEISSLYEVSQSISFSGTEDDLLQHIINSVAHAIGVERASIILFDNKINELKLEAAVGLPETIKKHSAIKNTDTISGYVYKSGDPMIVNDIRVELPEELQSKERQYKTNAFIAIPVMHKKNTIGILSLADKIDHSNFDSFDLRVLSTISSQIAELYQNKMNQKFVEDRRKLAQEIDIAAEIQRKILPNLPKRFNEHSLVALNRPAKEIGGDFYDFFMFDNNKYGVLVADVSGKGIPAALFMGSARNVLRAETRIDRSPARLLKNANTLIYEDSESGMFVTLFYAVVDSHNNIITYGSAGHNSQILVKAMTGEIVQLAAEGTALGILDNQEFEEKVQLYGKGDMLVLFTDGVLECLAGDSLDIVKGEEQLIKIILSHFKEEASILLDYIREELDKHSIHEDLRDDITIVIIQF